MSKKTAAEKKEEKKEKKKKKLDVYKNIETLEELEKQFEKDYGKGIIKPASYIKDVEKTILSIGPQLDIALNGGLLTGNLVLLSGFKKCGKTTLALEIASKIQAMGRQVFYLDIEHRWKEINLYGVRGFDGDKARVIQSTIDRQLSGEDFLQMGLDIIRAKTNQGGLLILDSTSSLCPQDVMVSGEVSSGRRLSTPKLLADFIRQASGIISVMDFTVIVIQHIIANTSGYGAPFLADGGNALQYQKDTHIQCTKTPVELMDGESQVGQVVIWDVITSAMGPPVSDIESTIRFGYGIDDITENIELGVDFNFIRTSGSWYYFDFLLDSWPKLTEEEKEAVDHEQGILKSYKYMRDNPDKMEVLNKKLKEHLIR